MKRITLLLCVLLGFSAFSQAEEVEETRAVNVNGLVKIKNLRGEVRIEGWAEAEVYVAGDLDELATGLRFEVDSNKTEIEVEMPSGNVNWGDGSDLVIMVPVQSRLAVDAVSTDLEVIGVQGDTQLRTISGEIELSDGRGKMSLKTVSGSIRVDNTQGNLRVSSSSGEIEVSNHQGDVDAQAMSGEIELDVTGAMQIRSSTISGDISVESSFLANVQAEFSSVSGDVNVTIVDPENLTIVARTTSGDIDNDLTRDSVNEAYGQQSLQVQLGNGSGTLGIRAVSGNIELSER
jgi:DUF4097 and DUF4098 domain-containing protein YvlB